MINPVFKAVYNIFNRRLAVLYGNKISMYTFSEQEEWTKISFNGDQDHPHYLHVQLDYDEHAQLLFYPREDGSESLNEDKATCFYSCAMNEIPDNLVLVYDDDQFNREMSKLGDLEIIEVEEGL